MLIVALSSMGLPGLNGFVGEFVILLGAWGAGTDGGSFSSFGGVWFAAIAAIGIIMAAVYILFMFQKMFLGPQGEIVDEVKGHGHGIRDLNWREIAIMVPILILIFWIGLYPAPFFNLMAPAVDKLAAALQTAALAMR
jgi:NADH-quinone oxidoreductase subunit M